MTPDELTAIERRAEAATKGPWAWDHSGVWTENPGGLCGPVLDTVNDPDAERGGIGYVGDSYPRGINRPSQSMEFIAAARTDVPALCREVRRLTAELAAAKAEIKADEEVISDLEHAAQVVESGTLHEEIESLQNELAAAKADTARLDWLEAFVNREPLLLHDGSAAFHGYSGLGLRPGALVRTLREAIDTARAAGERQG